MRKIVYLLLAMMLFCAVTYGGCGGSPDDNFSSSDTGESQTITDDTDTADDTDTTGGRGGSSGTSSDVVDLSTLTANYTAQDGETLTGRLIRTVKISIADGAAVTLNNITINGYNSERCKWAGLTCEGNAAIVLRGINIVKGFHEDYSGIYVPEGKTLTIKGGGSLNASSYGWGAGIGGCCFLPCGNIVIARGTITAAGGDNAAGIGGAQDAGCGDITITGGKITATGGNNGAGIGSGFRGSCGNITITGGTTTATGGYFAAGIGSGQKGSCGDITINDTVKKVTATRDNSAPNSIGAGYKGKCGKVTISGNVEETSV